MHTLFNLFSKIWALGKKTSYFLKDKNHLSSLNIKNYPKITMSIPAIRYTPTWRQHVSCTSKVTKPPLPLPTNYSTSFWKTHKETKTPKMQDFFFSLIRRTWRLAVSYIISGLFQRGPLTVSHWVKRHRLLLVICEDFVSPQLVA